MTLAKEIQAAVDGVFSDDGLGEFRKIAAGDGVSLRRYYNRSESCECEVSVSSIAPATTRYRRRIR